MTFQAIRLLRKIKKAQTTETGSVWIDEKNKALSTVVGRGDKCVTVDLSKNWGGFFSTARYLEEQNLAEWNNSEYIKLNHNGYFYFQEKASAVFRFLISSVLVPIAVAFITTLLSLWVTGVFKALP